MNAAAELALQTIRSWVGQRNQVIDIYNSYLPHPRGYKVKYDDQACATIVSAIYIFLKTDGADWTDIVPPECAAWLLYRNMDAIGCATLDAARTPDRGELIFFGVGSSYRNIDHVGIVDEVKPDGRIYFYDIRNTVTRHSYKAGVKSDIRAYGYILGYAMPDYESKNIPEPEPQPEFKPGDLVRIKDGAKWYNGASIQKTVFDQNWYIIQCRGDRAVLGMNEAQTRNIQSPIHVKYLEYAKEPEEERDELTARVKRSTLRKLERLAALTGADIGEVLDGLVEDYD